MIDRVSVAFLFASIAVAAQLPAPPPTEPLRVTVTLVQVDAVVTDQDGRQVKDITADDFEIYQDGRRQKVARSAYVPILTLPPDQPAATGPLPPVRISRDQVTRSYAIVVNDFFLRHQDVQEMRRSLHAFIDTQMQPGDLVAVLCLGRNIGALQQFTADKTKLHAAVENIRAYPPGCAPMTLPDVRTGPGQVPALGAISVSCVNDATIDVFKRLAYVLKVLKELPGRKSVLFYSDPVFAELSDTPALVKATEDMLDEAMRARVSIYGIDSRAEINLKGTSDFSYLCNATGGQYLGGLRNELGTPIKQAMDQQQGYYSLAYTPDEKTFEGRAWDRAFHKIEVRVKRPGYRVSANGGFRGVPDQLREPRKPVTELLDALGSPFGAAEIEASVASVFLEGATGPAITALMNVKAADLSVTERDGLRIAAGEVLIMVFGDNGVSVYNDAITFTARLNTADYARAMADGFLFTFRVPMKRPGAYDVRVAVRDKSSGRMGTASSFIRVPERGKNRIALSGILLQSPPQPGDSGADLRGASATRTFHAGDLLVYAYQILNPKLKNSQPQLESNVTIFRDGKPVTHSGPAAVPGEKSANRIAAGGELKLGPEIIPGEYILQVNVTDLAANRTEVSQMVDFVVK